MIDQNNSHSSSVAARLMAIEVISELLINTSPRKLGETLTEHLRELSGARTVMALAHRPEPELDVLLNVSPARRATLFSAGELNEFCSVRVPGPLPLLCAELPEHHPLKPLLTKAGIGSMARFPLRAGGEYVGLLLLFELPDVARFAEMHQIITLLSPPIALALKNALDFQVIEHHALEMERRVEERTFELLQSNRELQQSEERHRTILQAAMDGFWLTDMRGRLLEVNEAYCRMSGYSEQELLTKDISDLEAVETPDDVEAHMEKDIRLGWDRFETVHRRKDGTQFDVEISVQYRSSEEGQFVVFVRDISGRKKAENEKAHLESQLQQAQKMESVGRLAGGVAHDFNNMLGVIIGHAELALLHLKPSNPLYSHLVEISKAADRSADLTRQLLAFARKQTIAPKVLDLNDSLASMLKMLQRLIGEDIHLYWQPSSTLWAVLMDPSQLDQILANLCVNARDAINGVGRVTIETANCTIDPSFGDFHSDIVPGEYVRLSVSDDGRGMDREMQSHIFEPFFTTKGVGEGTGLGLATVYGAVKQNKGYINVYSEPGQGTTFSIYIPRHTVAAEQAEARALAAPAVRGKETILLVEDESAILKMTTLMLEKQGYNVLVANSPGEAVRLAREHNGAIHLLMTDVIMPEMNGRDLARNLLSIYPDMKRLFMSGYTADVIAHHGVLAEGVCFIQKPFSINELAAMVRKALDGS